MAGGEDFRLFKFDYETGKELGNFIDNVIYAILSSNGIIFGMCITHV